MRDAYNYKNTCYACSDSNYQPSELNPSAIQATGMPTTGNAITDLLNNPMILLVLGAIIFIMIFALMNKRSKRKKSDEEE